MSKNKLKKIKKKITKYFEKNSKKLFLCVFILGFVIMMYPLVSQLYYRVESNKEIAQFNKDRMSFSSVDIQNKLELAKEYNTTLDPIKIADAFSEKQKAGIAEYGRMLAVREKIGYIEIPKIDQKIPIYAGTPEEVLQKGAGHLEGTSLPVGGRNTHSVITAHRGLPTAELFTNLDKLEKGDIFYLHNVEKILSYKVDKILTVEPSDFKPIMVTIGSDYCTLLTCTPYMINSHRLLVRGHRVPYIYNEHKEIEEKVTFTRYSKIVLGIIILLILLVYFVKKTKKQNKPKK